MRQSWRWTISGVSFEFHPIVFPVSAVLMLLFVAFAASWPAEALMRFNQTHTWIVGHFAWLYIPSLSIFFGLALFLIFSRFGAIKLGPDDAKPEFSRLSWFAMLFSAGMGIGMIFYGVVEPMTHFINPPSGDPRSLDAARSAMAITMFHWGFHPWALYGLTALSLSYFGFRRGLPLSFRSVFYPLFGRLIYRELGDFIDIIAVLATLFGLATSLGLGAKQINAGLYYLFGWPEQSVTTQVILIAAITSVAIASLVSGIHAGIKWLSNINLTLAGLILLYLFVLGPTVYLLGATVENLGAYVNDILYRSFWTASYTGESKAHWFSSWTIFYWGWWLSWSPYVGGFIARISKGRTIREFLTGVLIVPTAVSLLWMTGFGSSGLLQVIYPEVSSKQAVQQAYYDFEPRTYPVQVVDSTSGLPLSEKGQWWVAPLGPGATQIKLERDRMEQTAQGQKLFYTAQGQPVQRYYGVLVNADTLQPYWPKPDEAFHGRLKARYETLNLADFLDKPVLNDNHQSTLDTVATSLFVMLNAYPLSWLLSILGIISITLFFITSSDSASLVADIIASGGSQNPTTGTRIFWAMLEGLLAAALLIAGGLAALQTGAITLGLPLCIGILVMAYSLIKGLHLEDRGLIPQAQKDYIKGVHPT